MDTLDRLKKDKELRIAYEANIAMAFKDAYAHAKRKSSI